MHASELTLYTVDVVRNGFGRRYTGLYVDQLDQEGFLIDCSAGYLRPAHYDLLPGDLVRWKQQDRYVEATIVEVVRDEQRVQVTLRDATLLPPEFFPY